MGNHLPILRLTKKPQFKANSVIIITGASSGIGKELAIQYSQRKCRLLLAARSEDKLKEVVKICTELGSIANYCICDVSKEEDCKKLIDECLKIYGEIDILVLNAGVNAHFKFEDIEDLSLYRKIMETNFFGYVYCTKYAFPYLKKNVGQIIVLSSISGEVGLPLRTAYCSSKFAVTGFFEALRIEQEDPRISITIVCPPSVKTPMRENSLMERTNGGNPEESEKRISVEECARTIIEASDRRGRKIFFPFMPYFAVYLRPILPDLVDKRLKEKAKL